MRSLTRIAVLTLSLGWLSSAAEGPPALDTFTSPDGSFQFVYPESYALLVGESILRATQGRNPVMPVCNFATALACVIYPIEEHHETRLEAAGFSVGTIAGAPSESDCMAYADSAARSRGTDALTSITLHSLNFRRAIAMKRLSGHLQSSEFYRTFRQQKCYELQVAVSMADEPIAHKPSSPGSLGDPQADSARESLRLVLSSTVFEKE